MPGITIRLVGPDQRSYACAKVKGGESNRSLEQNAKMWAMLSDIARARPEGRHWTTDTWKAAFMHSLGHHVQFAEGIDNTGPFPVGFRTSRLSKGEMADLITCIQEYGDRHGVEWKYTGEWRDQ